MATTAVSHYVAIRDEVRRNRMGDGGGDVCRTLTAALDDVLGELHAPLRHEPLAVVAIGGYGRGEQCLFSDVDVMLLHEGADLDAATNAVFYPLWDANLRVGHSVRTVREAVAAAREHFETLTSLLTMRVVAGEAGLVTELEEELRSLIRGRPLAPRLAGAERTRRDADPYPVMAADLKEGRGGLRTFSGLHWERRRAELLWPEAPPPIASSAERQAQEDLLAIRNALHAAAGRAFDTFAVDLRTPAARWLDADVTDVAGRMCRALQLGDRLAMEHWPDLLPGHGDPMAGMGRRFFGRVIRRFRTAPETETFGDRPLNVAVQAAGRREGVWLADAEKERIRQGAATPWNVDDRTAFLQLLAGGARGRAAFGLLDELGWVERHLPEWSVVRALPQLAPFHEHPVDAHLWRTVDEMRKLIESSDAEVSAVVAALGSTEELYLAAFFHDIGKGHGGQHEHVGAAIVRRFLHDTGFGAATVGAVTDAVRHHLLLAETATRRDLDDPAVISAVVAAAGDVRTLQILYLLAIADLRATGATMWTPWKQTLLDRLYRRAAHVLETGEEASPNGVEDIVAALDGRWPATVVRHHLAAMPPDYLAAATPEAVARHLALLAADPPVAAVGVESQGSHEEVVVVGPDRPGFLGAVAGVLAMHGLSVLGARLFTRRDGMAIDAFMVRPERTRNGEPFERWDDVARDVVAALQGELDVTAAVAARAHAYRHEVGGEVPLRVQVVPGASRQFTVVEVRCADRIGRLAELVAALYELDLEIALAKLDTRAGEVVDVFYVRREGKPITTAEDVAAMTARLEARLATTLGLPQ